MRKEIQILTCVIGFFALISSDRVFAQDEFQWAKRFGGSGNDQGNSIAVDDEGNLYTITGFNGIVDFDPGPGTLNLGETDGNSIAIIKLDALGNLIWAKHCTSTSSIAGLTITSDNQGNVYAGGWFSQTVDFDPGPEVFNLTGPNNGFAFVLKLDNLGNFAWVKLLANSFSEVKEIKVDDAGDVFVVGVFENSINVSTVTENLTIFSAGGKDIFVVKMDTESNVLWGKTMGGTSNDIPYSLAIDVSGNLYVAGTFRGTCDFDTGVANFNLVSAGLEDAFVTKLDNQGALIWAKRFGGTSIESCIDVAVTANNDLIIAGSFFGIVDFDPGAGTANTPSAGARDVYILRWNSGGEFVWVRKLGGLGTDEAYAMSLDANDNIYTTGEFLETTDLDPSAANFPLTSSGGYDVFVSKLNASGDFVWANSMGGTGADVGLSVAVNSNGNVHVTGYYSLTANFNPLNGGFNLTSVGGVDIFIYKFGPCTAPPQPTAIAGNTEACQNQQTSYSIPVVTGATSYIWTLPSGWLGSSGTNQIQVTPSSNNGVITVTAVNDCSSSVAQTLSVTTLPSAAVGVSISASPSSEVSEGSSVTFTATPTNGGAFPAYQWKVNGSNVGSNSPTYTSSSLSNGDVVTCQITSNAVCPLNNPATSNSITMSIITGVDEIETAGAYKLYPNPATNHIDIVNSISRIAQIEVFNGQGQLLLVAFPNSNRFQIQLENWSPQLYFISISDINGEITRRKFVKM